MTQAKVRESSEEYVAETKKASRVLYKERPLLIPPNLAAQIGLNNAIFVQQLEFWLSTSQHFHDGKRWAYNTVDQWSKQFPFWSRATIERIVAELRLNGVVVTTDKYNDDNRDRTLWYTIDYEKLDGFVSPKEGTSNGGGQKEGTSNGGWHNIQRRDSYKTENTTHKNTTEDPRVDQVVVDGKDKAKDIALAGANAGGGAFAAQKTPRVQHGETQPPPPPSPPKERKQGGKKKAPQLGFGQLGMDNIDAEAIGEKTSEFQDMKAKVYEILGWDPRLSGKGNHIQVSKLVKEMRDSNYTVDSLRDFWNHIWSNDFRWTLHRQRPTLAQLRSDIGKLRVPIIAPAAPKKIYGLSKDKDGNFIRREADDGQLPSDIPQLTDAEVEYYKTPRAKRMGEN